MTAVIGDNNHDLSLYYNDTFVKIKTGDVWKWHYISMPVWERGPIPPQVVILRSYDHKAGQNVTLRVPRETIDVDTGNVKYYFDGTEAFYLRRLPIREAHRAMSTRNTRLINPLENIVPPNFMQAVTRGREVELYLDVLNGPAVQFSLVDGQNYLMNKLKSHKPALSVPLVGDRWCLSLAFDGQMAFDLWYKLVRIGEITKDNKFVPIEKDFVQEVRDNFPELTIVQ